MVTGNENVKIVFFSRTSCLRM